MLIFLFPCFRLPCRFVFSFLRQPEDEAVASYPKPGKKPDRVTVCFRHPNAMRLGDYALRPTFADEKSKE